MFIILDYSSALEYSIIRRYTNIVYYYYDRGRWVLICVVWHSGRGVCVERYVIEVGECFGYQFATMVICV